MSWARYDIGFLGGGQLARMSIQAAQRMGLKCLSLDEGDATPASEIAPAIQGGLSDPASLERLFSCCERVTLENEFVPAEAVRTAMELAGFDPEYLVPGVETLATIQDKLLQRQALERAGVPSPKAMALPPDGRGVEETIGFPCVLKARFGGYDGKGTKYARTPSEFAESRALWSGGGWLAEAFVPFRRELAQMVYVSNEGSGAFPTMESVQTNHVCDLVYPAGVDAAAVAMDAVRAVGGKGLFGVEMFELQSGEVLINEIAPRPHNSGHYTLDWGGISQFEQHVRLTLGHPCGRPDGLPVCMANLLGQPGAKDWRRGLAAALEDPLVRVHWYGKSESRPGRKMGHLNALGEGCIERAKAARVRFYQAWTEGNQTC